MATLGGPAIPVSVQTGDQQQGGPAIPVAVVSDGRATQGGPAQPVYVVTSGPTQGGPALPVVVATGAQASQILAGPAIPVYVVSGILGGVAPVNIVLPAISGTAAPGQVLTTTDGTWTGDAPIAYTYQWKRGGVAIGGATANTYTVVTADVDTTTTVTVTATNSAGSTAATSAGVTFTPTQIANLEFGVDAGSLAASPVSTWPNLSSHGAARDVVQATGIRQPTWSATAFNTSYPGVTFDGLNDFLQSAAFTLNQPLHYFLVCRLASTTLNAIIIDGVSGQVAIYQNPLAGDARLYAGVNGPVVAIGTTPHVISAQFNGASSSIAIDNAAPSAGAAGAANPGGVTFGADFAGAGAQACNVIIAACWIYSSILSAGDETNLIRYLGARYGVTVA